LNVLTKICIVVLVVLVIFSSAVFITKATVDPVYATEAQNQKNRADILSVQVANDQVAIARQVRELEQTQKASASQAKEAAERVSQLQSELIAEKGKNQQLASEKDVQWLTLSTQSNNISVLTNQNKLFIDQLKAAQTLASDKQIESQKLSASLQDLKSLRDRQDLQLQTLTSQLADAQEEARRARTAGPSGSAGSDSAGQDQITGTVSTVRNDLASINIGSSNGVKKGQKLVIFRDGKFVGYLQVEQVDASEAAGIVMDKVSDPVKGDKVTNKL
jgi:hypothetical protein